MSIKDEIHKALNDIQRKVNENNELSENELEMLMLAALIEEEA
jgi:hypothetical protein